MMGLRASVRNFVRILLAFGFASVITACSPAAPHIGMTLNRGNGGEPASLDPHFIDLTLESNIVGDLLVGLVTEDPAGKPIPGAAVSWETSTDGLTWTFKIRHHLWSDGVPVTSQDFLFAWRRILDPQTGAKYGYNMWVFKNAEAISNGRLPPSALGAEAPNDDTLILHLAHPAPYLPQLLMHQSTFPVPRHVLFKYGNSWSTPAHYVSNGAYLLKEWYPNDHITLVRNKLFYDAAHVRVDTVNYFPTSDTDAALRRLRAGELDTQNPLPASEIGWMRTNIPRALQVRPYLGVWYLVMNETRAPFGDRRVREAVNLAVSREMIAGRVYRLGERPAYSMVPPGVANFPGTAALDFRSMTYEQRVTKAQALMREAGYGSTNRVHVTYETTSDPDNKRSAAAFQSMLKQIYMDVDIAQVDVQIHFANMRQHDFDIAAATWIADFDDASNFLDILRSGSGMNYGLYKNPAYDALLDKAQLEPEAKNRGDLLDRAEQIALDDYAWAPIRFLVTRDLVQPYVRGWVANILDVNRTRWLRIEGRPAPP
ncbi:MAG: peptide ABC transporter substrate-binding protein [Rhizomicrobium sp.]